MKLIIGLGNPEEKYKNTRHNVGFYSLTHYSQVKDIKFQLKDKFKAYLAEFTVDNEKILLAKPTTYYNLGGEAARLLTDFYKITPENVLVIHDELMLPFGTLRTRLGGSDAGNNGIKSISDHLGSNTARLRIGIYNELRDRMDDADFVLSNFSGEEQDALTQLQPKLSGIIDSFINGAFDKTTHR